MKLLKTIVCSLAIALPGVSAVAADYPTRPVTIVVPYGPGGSTDVLMRVTAKHLETHLGQKIVVKNVPGAGGSIGWTQVKKAKADGYTIAPLTNSMMVRQEIGASQVGVHDFTPVANLGFVSLTVTGKGKGGKYNDFAELVDAAKKAPGEISIGMSVGSPAQFAAAEAESASGAKFKLVNTGDGGSRKAAALGGHIDSFIQPINGVAAGHKDGSLKVLAVMSEERLPFLSDIPTAKELGFDVVYQLFYGMGVPKGTSEDRIAVLQKAFAELGDNEAYQKELAGMSFLWSYSKGEEFQNVINSVEESVIFLAKDLGFKK